MLTNNIAKRLESDNDWQHVQKHINEEIAALDSLEGIDFTDKEKGAVAAQGRVEAKRILESILEPFLIEKDEEENPGAATAARTGVDE